MVRLADEHGAPLAVLREWREAEGRTEEQRRKRLWRPKGSEVTAELKQLAATLPGNWLAVEWLGPLGWVRFQWLKGVVP